MGWITVESFRVKLVTRIEVEAVVKAEDARAAAEQLGVSLPYLAADIDRALNHLGPVSVGDFKVGRLRQIATNNRAGTETLSAAGSVLAEK